MQTGKLLADHHLKATKLAARDEVRLQAAVRAERLEFPEQIESLLPPPLEQYRSRQGWPHYERFHALCQLYHAATPSQRQYIRSQITWPRAYQLGLFRIEAKERAVATKSAELLRLAVVSLAIADFNTGDARDAILSLGSLLKASRETGADWSALASSVANLAGPGMAALIHDFLSNHPT